MALLVSNVPWVGEDSDPKSDLARALGIAADRIRAFVIVRKSLDARWGKQSWRAAFKVEVDDETAVLKRSPASVRVWTARDETRYGLSDPTAPTRKSWPQDVRPIVVGAGPAGLFAALYLAEQGAPVVLFDRGGPVEDRVPAVNKYWQRKEALDPENNLVFGEGGAGTFSDGKIYTRRRDGDLGYVFRRFVDFGADPAILQESYAHLGTDKIRALLPVFRKRLAELGVEVRYHTKVTDLVVEGGRCVGVVADGKFEKGGPVLVACGHSARDAAEMLVRAGVTAEARPIAIGCRIEHPQGVIDAARYGHERGELPAASYRLAWNPPNRRHAHTFCMCPGGMVVPAQNEPERVVVNGMSFAARRAFWANSAIIVEVHPDDYGGEGPLRGYAWQDRIEHAAFVAGGSDYKAPAQRLVDLAARKASAELPKTSYPMGIAPYDLRELLPEYVVDGMIGAVRFFDRKLPGFAGPEALLIAPETRTTSPVRFLRDERQQATTVQDLFPIGEGAGYGGGIISCALDGFRAARAIVASVS